MLVNFFQLNASEAAQKVSSQEDLLKAILANSCLENIIYLPIEFKPPRPRNVIREKTFKNVSFKSTYFYDVEFRECAFEDCLFIGSEFDRCEFHDCRFSGSNLHKARFTDTYINPESLIGVFDPKNHANIGVWVFQQLRSNALNTHQPEFFQTSDWQFRRWLRHELVSAFKRKKKTLSEIALPVIRNWVYEFFIGYGHSLRRFSATSLVLFVMMVCFNCWFWNAGRAGLAMNEKIQNVNGIFRTIYYTVVTLTTVGYGDITPITAGGMLVAGAEALLGLVWFGMLTSIIVKKVFR